MPDEELLAKIIRFILVGISSGAIYAGVTALLVSAAVAPVPASLVGYAVSVPTSFLGHRRFSFRSNGHWTAEAVRFVVMQAINIAVTAAAMHGAVGLFHVPYYWGMAATVVLVPIANFICMNVWVFRNQTARPE